MISSSNVTRLFNFRPLGKKALPYGSAIRPRVRTRTDTMHIVSVLRIEEQTGFFVPSIRDFPFDFINDISA
jgi:hypothetical protein